ncbi:MAG: isocitrate lyase/phosphoenolpyruvate mutase family protein [Hyphomicrobiaceae bacterium]
MSIRKEVVARFRELHAGPGSFVIPNPWDIGSARLLAGLGFEALATTSSGFAWSTGRTDGQVSRDEVLDHCRSIAAATPLPVNADLEKCFADDPAGVADTIALVSATGVAGASVEDFSGDRSRPIYDFDHAVARVKAAVAAAHAFEDPILICARTENYLHGRRDLADTIARLKAFADVGADVLYAPGLAGMEEIKALVAAVDRPVNVLVSSFNADLTVDQLTAAGVRRISVGGALARAAMGGLLSGAREIMQRGTFGYGRTVPAGTDLDAAMSAVAGTASAKRN